MCRPTTIPLLNHSLIMEPINLPIHNCPYPAICALQRNLETYPTLSPHQVCEGPCFGKWLLTRATQLELQPNLDIRPCILF